MKKRILSILLIVTLVVFPSCANKSPAYLNYDSVNAPSEEYIIECLERSSSVWIWGIEAVTEENDPNGTLHKAGGYTACVYFESYLIDQTQFEEQSIVEKGTDCGGCIEVYASVEDAERRNEYLSSFDGTVLASGSHTVVGTVIVRTSDELTATQQKAIEANIISELIYVEVPEKKHNTKVTVESIAFAKMMAEKLFLSKDETIWELKKQGYSDENIVTILEQSDISWDMLALNRAIAINGLLATPCRSTILEWLTDCYSFTKEEAEYAIQNCDINWKNNLLAEWTLMCLDDVENAIDNMNSYQTDLKQEVLDRGFTEEELEYVFGNIDALIHVLINLEFIENNQDTEELKQDMQFMFSAEQIEFAFSVVEIFEDEINHE